MTHLFNDPSNFVEDMLAGFVDANSRYVTQVPGGVVRSTESPAGKVAVVVGGGSGHYPAFAGIVGPGFADGAVVGNVFTSPSVDDVYRVARAADNGGGVIVTAGNYAGDVMHFTAAAERLNEDGIPSRVLFVTDDVASASADEPEKRRGIAGDVVVFKVMSAAAEQGYSLDEVLRVGQTANARTRTLGVAFAGCTLPGASEPLFTVPDGRMGLGLGIHGEPGISEDAVPSASELASMLVEGVLEELRVEPGARVGTILNGLGATKYEELFVVWSTVAALLRERGLQVVDPEVGELVTSLDMAGCSLTVVHLDDELSELWQAPAQSPAFKKGALEPHGRRREVIKEISLGDAVETVHASPPSRACATRVLNALIAIQTEVHSSQDEFGRLDSVAGDGDHGRGMVRGIDAAVAAATTSVEAGAGAGSALTAAGQAWETKAGGSSGALWGAGLRAAGARLGDNFESLSGQDVAQALRAASKAVAKLGGASLGDKTMLDALIPFNDELDEQLTAGASLAAAWSQAAEVGERAAQETAALRPRIGRARPLADKSLGTPDPGATSLARCLASVTPTLSKDA